MSIRQRVPFRLGDDGYALDEQGHVLDEQEQEEVIQSLKDKSQKRNTQYSTLLQLVIGLSATLHVIFLFSPSKQSPLAVLYLQLDVGVNPQVLPWTTLFALINIFVHANLSMHLLPSSHSVRSAVSSTTSNYIPLAYPFVIGTASIAPLVSLLWRLGWLELVWWSATVLLSWFIYSGQDWMREEEEALHKLENLRYDARGA